MDIAKLQALMTQKKKEMKRTERALGFKDGKNRIRIAQGWRVGEEHVWFHDFGQHFIKDAADQIQAVYLCMEHTYNKPCSVCAAIKGAIRISDDATSEIVAKAVSGKVFLVNAFHLDSDTPNTPQVTAIKGKLFAQLTEMLEENGPEAFFDLEKGHEIIVTRTGKGLGTTYSGQMSIKVGAPIPAASLKQLVNLDEYVAQQNEEQERRAIAAVNTVAGISAPSAPLTTPAMMGTAAGPALAAPARAAAPAPVSANDVSLDDDLDSILGDLPDN